jgi:hypothetical protein
MTDDAALQPAVAAEFLALADLLDSAAEARWDRPWLCAGWRVREVVEHMTMAALPRGQVHGRAARLQATDLDCSHGSGSVVRGKAEDLALVLGGGSTPAGRIEGKPL